VAMFRSTERRDYSFLAGIVDGVIRATDRCASHHLYNLGNSGSMEVRALIDAIGSALRRTPFHKGLALYIAEVPHEPDMRTLRTRSGPGCPLPSSRL
jgi:hypothetical protein